MAASLRAQMPGACGCSTSRGVAAAPPLRRAVSRRCPLARAQQQRQQRPGSGGGGGGADDLGQKAQELFTSAARSAGDFVRERELDKRAAAAYADASESLRTSFARLDAEYELGRRLSSLQGRVGEAAADVDQRFSLRRRARAALQDARRLAPIWWRRGREFGETGPGKVAYTAAFVCLLLSGALFKVLNLLWLGWWVAVPLSLVAAEQQRRKEREAAASAAASARSNGGFWRGRGGSGGAAGGGGGGFDASGPIVDAEWVSLDDDGKPVGGGKSRR